MRIIVESIQDSGDGRVFDVTYLIGSERRFLRLERESNGRYGLEPRYRELFETSFVGRLLLGHVEDVARGRQLAFPFTISDDEAMEQAAIAWQTGRSDIKPLVEDGG